MARIRTIKPDFWEDEKIGMLSHGARLLFLCSLNLCDDEGLLRWNEFYLASNAFMYDDIKIETIQKWMNELVENELIYIYIAGKTNQKIGHVINFHKHQRIDKPQPSKFPPPNYKDERVKDMIAKRDKGICQICGNYLNEPPKKFPNISSKSRKIMMSCDHIKPRSKGGSDYFSNLQASHLYCNQSKSDSYNEPIDNNEDDMVANLFDSDSTNDSKNNSKNDSKNNSKNDSIQEKEMEMEKEVKENTSKEVSKKKEWDLSFALPSYIPIMEEWLAYKKERKQSYKPEGIRKCYQNLVKLSENNAVLAQLIVDQSIANNWSGLFVLKQNVRIKENSRPVARPGFNNYDESEAKHVGGISIIEL